MSVYKSDKKRKDGERWGYNIYHKDELTGKTKRITKETYKSRKEARNAERAMLKRIESGEYDPFHGERKEIVEELFGDWIDYYAKTGVTESTVRITEQGMRKHFVGRFGDSRINKLESHHLDGFFVDLASKLKNYRTYTYYVTQFFEYAKSKGIITDNPMDKRSNLKDTVDSAGNKVTEKVPVHYTENELDVVLDVMKNYLTAKQYTYFLLLAKTGLRKSEGLALHKDDIDLDNMHITINKTLTTDRNGKTIVADGTKSRARNDKSPVVLPLAPELKVPLQLYLKKAGRYNETQFFFPSHRSEDGHLSMSAPDKWLHTFYKNHEEELISKGVNHRIKVHGFRHSFVSIMQAKNYNPNVIMYLTRHANLSTTMDYSHFDVKTIEDLMG